MATPRVIKLAIVTSSPIQRTSRRTETARNTPVMAAAEASEYSYMLPQGARPAQSARTTMAAMSRPKASQVSAIPMLPARRPGGSSSCAPAPGGGAIAATEDREPEGPPTAAATGAAAATRPRSARDEANEAAKATIAIAYIVIAA